MILRAVSHEAALFFGGYVSSFSSSRSAWEKVMMPSLPYFRRNPVSARFQDFSAGNAESFQILAESARFQISSAISAEERPLSFGNAECRNWIIGIKY